MLVRVAWSWKQHREMYNVAVTDIRRRGVGISVIRMIDQEFRTLRFTYRHRGESCTCIHLLAFSCTLTNTLSFHLDIRPQSCLLLISKVARPD